MANEDLLLHNLQLKPASPGLIYFTQGESVAAPNDTVNASYLVVESDTTNADAVISAKGTGAHLAQIPDNLASGGNKRGQYATDWQTHRSGATSVASGSHSTISGGYSNTASGEYSTVSGGRNVTASGIHSTVSGGYNNTASAEYSTVSGGMNNTASGYNSTVSGGYSNTASGMYSTVSGGYSNTASGIYATVSGGRGVTASGEYSTVSGGRGNNTSAYYSTVSGGNSNTASGDYSTVSGGYTNTASNYYSTISGGNRNTASGTYSTVSGGYTNNASGDSSSVSGGNRNTASGAYSTVSGGRNNIASGRDSFIPGGQYGTTHGLTGATAHASGGFSGVGDAQRMGMVLRCATEDATPKVLTADAATADSTNQMVLPDKCSIMFEIDVISHDLAGKSAGWKIQGVARRDDGAAATAIVGTNTTTAFGSDLVGAPTTAPTATADTTNGAIAVTFTGIGSTNIQTVAYFKIVQTVYYVDD